MSSVPPNPPGGMPPYPPYDPKMQWRAYREQQKAAWRAQREAWRAQHHLYGNVPRVPSIVGPLILIAIGVVWLLVYSGRLQAHEFWTWYGRWWPLVLIAAGLALLGEWIVDARRPVPVHRRGSFVGILVLVVLLGLFANGVNHLGGPFNHWNWNGNGNDFFNMFGMPEHDYDQPAISQQIPPNATVEIENPRGNVSVSTGEGTTLQVQAHQIAYAKSDAEAQRIFEAEKASVTADGNSIVVRSDSANRGRVNLSVIVPATAHVTVNASHGDVMASGLNGIAVNTVHGDTHLSTISGPVLAHLSNNRGDFAARQVTGDINIEGNCGDLTLSDIKGQVTANGGIFGDAHLENITGPIKVRTSVTEIDVASLPGDLTLNNDDLHVNQAKGDVRISTHAKDVDLNQIYGDSFVENRAGTVTVEPAGPFGVEVRNSKGDVELTLPPNAAGTVDGRTHNGDVVTDYALKVSGDEDKLVTGKIGAGGPRINLSADNGDLRIKKGPAVPANPTPAAEAAAPAPPAHARHLKSSKALPAQPVTQ